MINRLFKRFTKAAGVAYATCSEDFIVRWAQTRAMRQGYAGEGRDDLPAQGPAQSLCNLEALRGDGETGS